mmetsp:Transcript_35492/g.72441  ORF Transcript_35492/g.72441 Transcript_35492/m.72441 type:complete len:281 (+) Transcript_35492:199-1041(+)
MGGFFALPPRKPTLPDRVWRAIGALRPRRCDDEGADADPFIRGVVLALFVVWLLLLPSFCELLACAIFSACWVGGSFKVCASSLTPLTFGPGDCAGNACTGSVNSKGSEPDIPSCIDPEIPSAAASAAAFRSSSISLRSTFRRKESVAVCNCPSRSATLLTVACCCSATEVASTRSSISDLSTLPSKRCIAWRRFVSSRSTAAKAPFSGGGELPLGELPLGEAVPRGDVVSAGRGVASTLAVKPSTQAIAFWISRSSWSIFSTRASSSLRKAARSFSKLK